jgi:hypothetical protein
VLTVECERFRMCQDGIVFADGRDWQDEQREEQDGAGEWCQEGMSMGRGVGKRGTTDVRDTRGKAWGVRDIVLGRYWIAEDQC